VLVLSIQLFEFIGTYFYTHSWSAIVAKTDLRSFGLMYVNQHGECKKLTGFS